MANSEILFVKLAPLLRLCANMREINKVFRTQNKVILRQKYSSIFVDE